MTTFTCLVAVLCFLISGAVATAQSLVNEIKLQADLEEAHVRPLETLVLQVLAYGEINEADETRQVRLQEAGANLTIKESNGGWLSKPFRFQGDESERFYEREGAGLGAIIFRRAASQYVLQDAVLYTAPESPGRYTVEAELNGRKDSITIEVAHNAPSRQPRETTSFPRESRSNDPYRRLAEHYAPFVAQETWFQPKSDYLGRFDLDGDWRGDNNWENAPESSSQAYVHYAAIETGTHWFLIYNLFHARDYSDKCVVGTCHENDNEGLILTVAKDGSPFGRLLAMETLAHNNIYSYKADRRVKKGIHNPDGEVELIDGSHPVIFVEAGGHGIYGSRDHHSLFSASRKDFVSGTGVTYVYKGVAERPQHANDRNVGYELLPIYDYWWVRAHEGDGRNLSFDEYYVYQPFGNRPRTPFPEIAGSFLGREYGENKAKPFWGWHDNRTRKRDALATGQWGLDPAYAVSRNLRLPGPFSLDYTFNPYLGIGRPTPLQITEGSAAPGPPATGEPTAGGEIPGGLRPFQVRRSGEFDPASKKGELDLYVTIDGEAEFYVQGETVSYRNLSGRPPQDDGSELTQPIPRAEFRKFEIDKDDGRGNVRLLETPSAANDYTAKLRISDPKGGDDRYHVEIKWEREQQTVSPQPSRGPSTILTRHVGLIGGGRAEEPSRQENLPQGVELFSDENDPSRYDQGSQGELEFQGRIDGTVVLRVQGDRVFAENLDGRPLERASFAFSQPLPNTRLQEIEVDRRDGRGKVVLLERPWEENNHRAVVQISDPKGGDDEYRFVLKWRR